MKGGMVGKKQLVNGSEVVKVLGKSIASKKAKKLALALLKVQRVSTKVGCVGWEKLDPVEQKKLVAQV